MRWNEIIHRFRGSRNTGPTIAAIGNEDVEEIIRITVEAFHGNGMTDEQVAQFIAEMTDWRLSKKMTLDDKLIGFYLFREGSVIDMVGHCDQKEDLSGYADKRGIEGIALVVKPEFRGKGYGDRLKDVPSKMGYDYVYGEQLKSLNNLPQWLKRRRLVADCGNLWVTLQDL